MTLAVRMEILPPLRHGVFGVDDEIHDDLLELAGIGASAADGGSELVVSSISSPMSGRRRRSMSATMALTSMTLSSRSCLRLKARSWRVSVVARSEAC